MRPPWRLCRGPLLVLGLSLAQGCGPGNCTAELNTIVIPSSATITVGQSITTSMVLTTCGGREQLADMFRWQTSAPSVASVDSTTGRVTGVAAGQATVTIRATTYGVTGSLAVTVQ